MWFWFDSWWVFGAEAVLLLITLYGLFVRWAVSDHWEKPNEAEYIADAVWDEKR